MNKTVAIATMLVAGLAGCAMHKDRAVASSMEADTPKPDAPWCPASIAIDYGGDGTPSAEPDRCAVTAGTEITWSGPVGSLIPFEIVFKSESPAEYDRRLRWMSRSLDKQYKVKIKASKKKGTYKYGIRANGKELDPVIIIK